jgi:cell division protein FtsB
MKAYRRARTALIVAASFALLTVATGFPLATLLRQRGEIAGAVRELQSVRAHNTALQKEVKSLSTRSTIVAIARQDYGLVRAGERAVVILPGKNGTSSAATELTPDKLPASDFVPSAATTWEVSSSAARGTSFWSRVFSHLEFWRGLF